MTQLQVVFTHTCYSGNCEGISTLIFSVKEKHTNNMTPYSSPPFLVYFTNITIKYHQYKSKILLSHPWDGTPFLLDLMKKSFLPCLVTSIHPPSLSMTPACRPALHTLDCCKKREHIIQTIIYFACHFADTVVSSSTSMSCSRTHSPFHSKLSQLLFL